MAAPPSRPLRPLRPARRPLRELLGGRENAGPAREQLRLGRKTL